MWRRVRLLVGAILAGALVGGICTFPFLRSGGKDALPGMTQEICRAIVANQGDRWEKTRQAYFIPRRGVGAVEAATDAAFRSAKAQSVYFHRGDRIGTPRERAFGKAGERLLVSIECPVGTPGEGGRAVTVRWLRDSQRIWLPDDITSTLLTPHPTTAANAR